MARKITRIAVDRASPADLIRLALRPMMLQDFATKHGFLLAEVSHCLHRRRRSAKVRMALAEELQVSRSEIDELLDGRRAAA